MIDRDKWRKQLDANPALKERFFRHSLGENTGRSRTKPSWKRRRTAPTSVVSRASRITAISPTSKGTIAAPSHSKMRKMLEDNYRKVFVDGSDVSHGAIDNSSGWLAAKHNRTGRFKSVFTSNGETFQIPGTGESGGRRAQALSGFP
jgi:hypothetical protein